ncbi:MAG: hypothetical protein LBQ42_00065 [Synergistaceae bacterium]|jgi:hypothetical protein|nr:hypothetical protein [Synergistaceae bacterium]
MKLQSIRLVNYLCFLNEDHASLDAEGDGAASAHPRWFRVKADRRGVLA